MCVSTKQHASRELTKACVTLIRIYKFSLTTMHVHCRPIRAIIGSANPTLIFQHKNTYMHEQQLN